jgi:hypothetical protein
MMSQIIVNCAGCKESEQKFTGDIPYLKCKLHELILFPKTYFGTKPAHSGLNLLCPISLSMELK